MFTEVTYAEQAFIGCSNLKSVVFPNTMTTLGYNAFKNCTSLEAVGNLDSVTHLNYGVFASTGLTNYDVTAKNVEYMASAVFYNSGIRSVILPKIIQIQSKYGSGDTASSVAYCTNLIYALLGEDCTSTGWRCFSHNGSSMLALICLAKTPPTSDGILVSTPNAFIYVPDDSVEVYQEATGWNEYSTRIKGISSLQTDYPDLYEEVKDYI